MALVLNGSDGTVGTPAVTGSTGGTGTGVYYPATNQVALATNGVQALLVDASQNIGVGTTPSAWSTSNSVKAVQFTQGALWGYSTTNMFLGSNYYFNGTNRIYSTTAAAAEYSMSGGAHIWYNAASGTAGNTISFTQAMTLDNSGNLLLGTNSGSPRLFVLGGSGGRSFVVQQVGAADLIYTPVPSVAVLGGESSSNAVFYVTKASTTSRSINAAGTVNQSGADYAEYMTKSGNFTIAKGDVVGINAEGKLTNVFSDAVSFVVKSTNPGLVGGDVWGTPEALGLSKLTDDATQEEKDTFETALEAARQKVDRIAFCGQVPVNVTGATAGQYIVPVAKQDGSIGGEAVSESAMTLQQYMQSVGKVISVTNNVTTIIVKVA